MDPIRNQTASSLSHRIWNYDVFISFRGEDTRKTFVSFLEQALVNRGIFTFKDNRKLEPGDSIPEKLRRGILTSRFAVVVISANFADSRWCLDELQLIMEEEIEVVPIFYGVSPSDVRNLRGKFSLENHLGSKFAEKVPGWRKALTDIADLHGKESTKCVDDATMTEEIAQNISTRLLSMSPIAFDDIVGMNTHMEVLNPLLDMESKDDARIIGISGTGGIGKTTIAKYIYEQLKLRFSTRHYFMENVAKLSREHGLLYLQHQLLSNVFRENNIKLETVEHGRQQLEFRLRHVKVLLVLDDVDDVTQLDALAKEVRWFGPGSRIIIATRDKSLLNFCSVYHVKYLDDDKALQLFEKIAFEGEPPLSSEYQNLSNWVCRLAQGLPLALKAFGFCLQRKSLSEWYSALESFDEAPKKNTMRILNVSYDSLDKITKTAFLYVACLFNGEPVWRVKTLLHHAEVGIKVLAEKSIIDISPDGRIAMHYLLEQTGKEIVYRESGNNPAQQQIFSDHYDIYDVFRAKPGTTKVEGVALDISEISDENIEWKLLNTMENLSFLKIYNYERYERLQSRINSNLKGKRLDSRRHSNLKGTSSLPLKLRLLHWDAYPFTTLPSSISPYFLVELKLCNSKLTTLWSGPPPRLSHLKRLNLTGSKYLKELPDLQEAVYLEELMLEGCISLKQIPKSICSIPKLQKLDLSNCDGFKNLRIIIGESEATVFQGKSFPVRSIRMGFLDAEPLVKESQGISLPNLSIKGNLKIELKLLEGYAEHLCFISEQQIPQKLMMLEKQTVKEQPPYGFKSLDIMRFNNSEEKDPFKCHSFSDLPWLVELNLINLKIEEIPDDIDQIRVLEKLNLSGNDFRSLPSSMIHLSKLKHVTLCNCTKLEALPELYQIEMLTVSDCTNLRALVSQQVEGRYSLLELGLDNCKNVESLSEELSHFTKLRYLDLSRHDFETVPSSVKDLSSLVTLCLNNCKKLKSLTELPLSLKRLNAHGCNSLEDSSLSIKDSIDHLDLSPCPHRELDSSQLITSFPRSEEVPVCACFHNTKILGTNNQGTRNIRSSSTQLLNSKTAKLVAFAMCTGAFVCYRRWAIARQ